MRPQPCRCPPSAIVMVMNRGHPGSGIIEIKDLLLERRILGGKKLLERVRKREGAFLARFIQLHLHGNVGAGAHHARAQGHMRHPLPDHPLRQRFFHFSHTVTCFPSAAGQKRRESACAANRRSLRPEQPGSR